LEAGSFNVHPMRMEVFPGERIVGVMYKQNFDVEQSKVNF